MNRAVVRAMKRKRNLTQSARVLCTICRRNALPKDASDDVCVRCRRGLDALDYDPAKLQRLIEYMKK